MNIQQPTLVVSGNHDVIVYTVNSLYLVQNMRITRTLSLKQIGVTSILGRGYRKIVLPAMGKGRLEAFSDGVIAVIITIMVLEMKVPHAIDAAALRPVLPIFLAYVLSFVFVGIYWNNHHHLFQATEEVSGGILWANLHLLFWLSLFPFTTAWMGENAAGGRLRRCAAGRGLRLPHPHARAAGIARCRLAAGESARQGPQGKDLTGDLLSRDHHRLRPAAGFLRAIRCCRGSLALPGSALRKAARRKALSLAGRRARVRFPQGRETLSSPRPRQPWPTPPKVVAGRSILGWHVTA